MARVALVVAVCAACGGASAPSAPPGGPGQSAVLTKMTVHVIPQTIEVGLTAAATVNGADQSGNPFDTGPVTWTSSAPSVASVSPVGVVTALAPGMSTITGEAGGFTSAAPVTVTSFVSPPVVLRISPEVAELDADEQLQLTGLRIAGADTTVVSPTTWESSAPAVASVSAGGVVTGVGGGFAVIAAVRGDLRGTMPVTVHAKVDTTIHVNVAPPPQGAQVGDSVRVVSTVTPLRRVLTRVVASIEGTDFPLDTVWLGAFGDVPGWGRSIPLRQISLGFHQLVITAFAADGSVSADTLLVDREVPQEGGTLPGGGRKRIIPVPDTLLDPPARRP